MQISIIITLRLCLVRVKAFLKNIPFSETENIFMCLVVFQKIFQKSSTARSSPTTAPSIVISRSTAPLWEIVIDGAISRSVDRDLVKHRADCDRREGKFAISDRDRRRWCLRTTPTGAWTCERRRLGLCLPLALSLSLSLQNSFEVKIGTKIHFRSQSLFFWVNGNQFLENRIFRTNQTPAFPEKHFRKWFSPKTNTA